MRVALLVVAGVALVGFLAVAFVLPEKAQTEARQAALALVSGAEPAKQQVAAAAEKSGSLSGAGKDIKATVKNDPKHGELKWLVSDNGAIRGWNEKNGLEITLTPSFQSGKAAWACKGYPVHTMPASCGGR